MLCARHLPFTLCSSLTRADQRPRRGVLSARALVPALAGLRSAHRLRRVRERALPGRRRTSSAALLLPPFCSCRFFLAVSTTSPAVLRTISRRCSTVHPDRTSTCLTPDPWKGFRHARCSSASLPRRPMLRESLRGRSGIATSALGRLSSSRTIDRSPGRTAVTCTATRTPAVAHRSAPRRATGSTSRQAGRARRRRAVSRPSGRAQERAASEPGERPKPARHGRAPSRERGAAAVTSSSASIVPPTAT